MDNDFTFAQAVKKKVSKTFNIAPIISEKYNHPSFYVEDLAEYISIVEKISLASARTDFSDVVYRGMDDCKYDSIPGLARETEYAGREYEMINDFITRRPDEFVGLSDFDIIAKMQHYGLPTRMLDFTSNPLIALFFACKSRPGLDGRVLCNGTIIENDSLAYVKGICSSAINKVFDGSKSIESYTCDGSMSLNRYLIDAYSKDLTTIVRPKYWNQRIANQSGVFLVFPNQLLDRYRLILVHIDELGVERAIQNYGFGKFDKEKIEFAFEHEPIDSYKNRRSSIITEKDVESLFDIYKKSNDISYFNEKLRDRFLITECLKPISKYKMANSFCSIIIPKNKKQKFIKELNTLGISLDYIYPELEYTAKSIIEKYKTK